MYTTLHLKLVGNFIVKINWNSFKYVNKQTSKPKNRVDKWQMKKNLNWKYDCSSFHYQSINNVGVLSQAIFHIYVVGIDVDLFSVCTSDCLGQYTQKLEYGKKILIWIDKKFSKYILVFWEFLTWFLSGREMYFLGSLLWNWEALNSF